MKTVDLYTNAPEDFDRPGTRTVRNDAGEALDSQGQPSGGRFSRFRLARVPAAEWKRQVAEWNQARFHAIRSSAWAEWVELGMARSLEEAQK